MWTNLPACFSRVEADDNHEVFPTGATVERLLPEVMPPLPLANLAAP